MYEMLLTYDDVVDAEVLDGAMTLLSDTNWSVAGVSGANAVFVVCLSACFCVYMRVFVPLMLRFWICVPGRATSPPSGRSEISCLTCWGCPGRG